MRVINRLTSVIAVLLAGCAAEAKAPSDVLFTELDGVALTVNTRPPQDLTRFSLSPPVITLEVPADDPQFFRVYNGFEDRSGFVTANTGTGHVHFFGPSGKLRFVVGGEGDGPGEFKDIAQVSSYLSDSVLVYDSHHGRMTILDELGQVGRTATLQLQTPPGRPSDIIWPLSDGGLVSRLNLRRQGAQSLGIQRTRSAILRYDAEGSLLSSIAEIPGEDFEYGALRQSAGGGTHWVGRTPPFGGTAVVTVGLDRVFASVGDGFDIGEFDLDGTMRRRVRWSLADTEVTPAEVAEFMDKWFSDGTEYPFPLPDPAQAYSDFLVAPEGELWVSKYGPGFYPLTRLWRVFAEDGQLLHEVDVGARTRVLGILSGGRVLAVRLDELDVETVHVFEIVQ